MTPLPVPRRKGVLLKLRVLRDQFVAEALFFYFAAQSMHAVGSDGPPSDTLLRAKAIAVYREMCGFSVEESVLLVNRDLERGSRLLEDIWPFGMAMFSNNIVEIQKRFLKQAFNEHNAPGGGKQNATGQTACGRPEPFVHSDADPLGQVLPWVFLYFHINLH